MPRPNLLQLQAELAAAGVVLPGALYTDDSGVVRCYDAAGVLTDLPPEAAPLVAAHVPATPPDPDAELRAAIDAATTLADLKAALLGKSRAGQVAGRPVDRA